MLLKTAQPKINKADVFWGDGIFCLLHFITRSDSAKKKKDAKVGKQELPHRDFQPWIVAICSNYELQWVWFPSTL